MGWILGLISCIVVIPVEELLRLQPSFEKFVFFVILSLTSDEARQDQQYIFHVGS